MSFDLETLVKSIAGNRFLPVPPPELHFVGDGDFRAIGAEFLRYFVEIGGLSPHDRVLEIGCGSGRMALPLTQYLDPRRGSYDGLDVVKGGIDWCREALGAVYPNFRFHHHDVRNDLYNPAGSQAVSEVALAFNDEAFDFVFLTSVITHLRSHDMRGYVREIGRLLRPGGVCFLSLFLMTPRAKIGLAEGHGRWGFDIHAEGPEYLADLDHPEAAIAYDEAFLVETLAEAGLIPAVPFAYGHWATGLGGHYQDLCTLVKTPETQG